MELFYGIILWKFICFISYGNERIFPSRDFIQQEVLMGLSRGNESSDCYCFQGYEVVVRFLSTNYNEAMQKCFHYKFCLYSLLTIFTRKVCSEKI